MDNEYETISESESLQADLLVERPHGRRDIGIGVLALLHVFSGAWRLYHDNQILGYFIYYKIWPDPKVLIYGTPPVLLLVSNICDLVILLAGVGMLFSARWGWWLAGLVYSYVVVRSIYMTGGILIRRDEFLQAGLPVDITDYIFFLILFSALLLYLYSNRALSSFNLQDVRKWKSIAIQIVLAIPCLAATTIIALLVLRKQGMSVPYIGE